MTQKLSSLKVKRSLLLKPLGSCGNIPSIIRDKVTGRLFEPGNINSLADAILYFLENRGILKKIGKNARKEVEDRYSWKNVAKKIEKLLKMSIVN